MINLLDDPGAMSASPAPAAPVHRLKLTRTQAALAVVRTTATNATSRQWLFLHRKI